MHEAVDTITQAAVMASYGGVGAWTIWRLRQNGAMSWYRKVALHAIGIASTTWAGFYGIVLMGQLETEVLAHLSRVGHLVTLGAFSTQAFMIQRAEQRQDEADMRRVERLLWEAFKESDEE